VDMVGSWVLERGLLNVLRLHASPPAHAV